MEFVIVYLLVNILVGVAACFFGKRLFFSCSVPSCFSASSTSPSPRPMPRPWPS